MPSGIGACKNRGAACAADRGRDERVVESHALTRQPVDVRSAHVLVQVTDSVIAKIVGEQEENIGPSALATQYMTVGKSKRACGAHRRDTSQSASACC